MSTSKVFRKFYVQLVKVLPMNDSEFVAELYSCDLLPGNLKDRVKAEKTQADKATCFLDGKINRDVSIDDFSSLMELLKIMEENEDKSLRRLATEIKVALKEGSPTAG